MSGNSKHGVVTNGTDADNEKDAAVALVDVSIDGGDGADGAPKINLVNRVGDRYNTMTDPTTRYSKPSYCSQEAIVIYIALAIVLLVAGVTAGVCSIDGVSCSNMTADDGPVPDIEVGDRARQLSSGFGMFGSSQSAQPRDVTSDLPMEDDLLAVLFS
jgi:hypothetical protein